MRTGAKGFKWKILYGIQRTTNTGDQCKKVTFACIAQSMSLNLHSNSSIKSMFLQFRDKDIMQDSVAWFIQVEIDLRK